MYYIVDRHNDREELAVATTLKGARLAARTLLRECEADEVEIYLGGAEYPLMTAHLNEHGEIVYRGVQGAMR